MQEFPRIEVGVLEDHRFSFKPRKIENIVQDDEQRLRRTLQGRGCGTLFFVQRRVQQELRHPNQSVHGRAQFMTHVGQKTAPQPDIGFRLVTRRLGSVRELRLRRQ